MRTLAFVVEAERCDAPFWHQDRRDLTWFQVSVKLGNFTIWTASQMAKDQEEAETVGSIGFASAIQNLLGER